MNNKTAPTATTTATTATATAPTARTKSQILNDLKLFKSKWSTLERLTNTTFPNNWKVKGIRKVAEFQPSLSTVLNTVEKQLYLELQQCNSKLDEVGIKEIVKERLANFASLQQNITKAERVAYATLTDLKINGGDIIPLDTLLEAERILKKEIAMNKEALRIARHEVRLEALSLIDSL